MATSFMSSGAEVTELLELIEQYEKSQKRKERKELIYIIGMVLLLVVTAGYMSFLYSFMSGFDANTVTAMAAKSLDSSLPELEKDIKKKLLDEAPNIISKMETEVLNAPAVYRPQLETIIFAKARAVIREMENKYEKEILAELQKNLEALGGPDKKLDDDIEKIVEKSRAQFKANIKGLLERTYPEFSAEMKKVNDYLTKLAENKNLSREEGVHRELIQATLAMMPKFNLVDFNDLAKQKPPETKPAK